MAVDAGVAGGSGEVLVLLVGDVVVRLAVAVLLRQAEVDEVHDVGLVHQPDQEVVRLYVSVDEIARVQELHSRNLGITGAHHLVRQHQSRLQAELPVAQVEQVFQVRPQHVHHHQRVLAQGRVHAAPVHSRNAGLRYYMDTSSVQRLHYLIFLTQLVTVLVVFLC